MHRTQNISKSRSTRAMQLRRGGGIAIAVILFICLILAVGLTSGPIGIPLSLTLFDHERGRQV
jgi:hypothetical protein